MQASDLLPALSALALGTALALVPSVPSGSWAAAAQTTEERVRGLAAEVGLADPPSTAGDPEPAPANETPPLDPRRDLEHATPTPTGEPGDPAPESTDDGERGARNESRGNGSDAEPAAARDPGADNRSQPEQAGSEPADHGEPETENGPPADGSAPDGTRLGLGMHVGGLRRMENSPGPNGSSHAYGQVWVGAWNLEHGWDAVDGQLDWLAEHNVTPVVQVFYWGNDISRACLEEGCNGKTPARWSRLVRELGVHLGRLQGREAIVVLEPEFNKGNVATYEPLDAALAGKAREVRKGYPDARVALGVGGWAPQFWDTWDRAMDASDLVGLQLMRGSTRDSEIAYAGAADTLVDQARTLHELSGKPVLVNDVALATHPGQPYLDLQAQVLGELLDRAGELRQAHVEGVVYRALLDDPGAPTAEYYGDAERTWGLKYANGTAKPAWDAWDRALDARGG